MLKKRIPATMDTVIGEHTTIKGSLESDSSVKIVGRVEGDIRTVGDVMVLVNAVVVGNIWADNLIIAGTVNGNVHAKHNLHLESTARLKGDMEIHSFVTDEGAVFEGSCKMIELPSEEQSGRRKMDFKLNKSAPSVVEEKESE